jgi:hypothetical protein
MSALTTSLAVSASKASFNVALNSSAAYGAAICVGEPDTRDIFIIVAIDTVFRIAIIRALEALHLNYHQIGFATHLIFPCLTLLTQPMSVKIARRVFNINQKWDTRPYFMTVFGYISLGWKLNMMSKDVIYINIPSLQKA